MDITNITNLTDITSIQGQGSGKASLTRNTDIVKSALYEVEVDILETYHNVPFASPNIAYRMNVGHQTRVRQSGELTGCKWYLNTTATITTLVFQLWRKNGSTYDLVDEKNIIGSITTGWNTVIFAEPIIAELGDYVAIGADCSAYQGSLLGRYGSTASKPYAFLEAINITPTNPYTWPDSQSNRPIALFSYSKAPMVVAIGSSTLAGHPAHYSFIEFADITDDSSSLTGQLYLLDSNYVYQNMGIGSTLSADVLARFQTDVVDLKPKIVIINIGYGDLSGAKQDYFDDMTAMFVLCAANDIIPIFFSIQPTTAANLDNTESAIRDDWMADLDTLITDTYNGIFIDIVAALGEFRTGGTEGNLWDLKAAYDSGDGLHLNKAAYTVIAGLIDTAIKEVYTLG